MNEIPTPICLTCKNAMTEEHAGLWICWGCDAVAGERESKLAIQLTTALEKLEATEKERNSLQQQVAMDSECIERCQQAGATAEVELDKLIKAMRMVANAREQNVEGNAHVDAHELVAAAAHYDEAEKLMDASLALTATESKGEQKP